MANERHDVFVGNVTFNTTEEQLIEIFSFVGPVKNIRILQDKESGRPKGFAFIEYNDANTALAAIRRLDGSELNGRKLRVSYSNNSNLRDLAKQIGQDVSDGGPGGGGDQSYQRVQPEVQVVNELPLSVAWDLLDFFKRLADEGNGEQALALLESYPQLTSALVLIQVHNVLCGVSYSPDSNIVILCSNDLALLCRKIFGCLWNRIRGKHCHLWLLRNKVTLS